MPVPEASQRCDYRLLPFMRKMTILIADDFSAFRKFIRLKLNEGGFRTIFEAEDGLEVVAKAAQLQPDLILLDIELPKLNGLMAAARIRSVAPESKILFISLSADPDIAQSTLSDGYVPKSEINHGLLPVIEDVLQVRRSSKVLSQLS